MALSPRLFLICCPIAALAGFIDSIAGGGGLLTLPGYLLAGLPAHLAYGTNKFVSFFGTTTAFYQYHRSGNVRWDLVPAAVISALAGAWCGAQLVLVLSDRVLRIFMMIALPIIAVFLLTNRSFGRGGSEEKAFSRAQTLLRLVPAAFGVGLYDGFFGPGAGTFYTLAFTLLFGMSLIKASGTAKALNLASNAGALAAYLLSGNVLFLLAIPCAVFSILGNLIGARMAVRIGAPLIRRVMLVVFALLLARLVADYLA